MRNGREIEGRITRYNIRSTDIFFNSKFELGNLKQAFIVPSDRDYQKVVEEDMTGANPVSLTEGAEPGQKTIK
jgi:hypothetical protein